MADVAVSLGVHVVEPDAGTSPVLFEVCRHGLEMRFAFEALEAPTVRVRRMEPALVVPYEARFVAAADLGPLPRTLTGDAGFDAQVGLLTTGAAPLARFGVQARELVQRLVILGAWGTCDVVCFPPAATQSITTGDAATRRFSWLGKRSRSSAGVPLEALPGTAFGDLRQPFESRRTPRSRGCSGNSPDTRC